ALAILIVMAQVHPWGAISDVTYTFVSVTSEINYLFPRSIKTILAPLTAVIILTAVAIVSYFEFRTVGDLGLITKSLPEFFIPDVPFNFETLAIIFPYSIALSIVGLLETLLTSSIVDDMTNTDSDKNREARGQGIANFITGFFGGMAGCAM